LGPNAAIWIPSGPILMIFGDLICAHVCQCQPEAVEKMRCCFDDLMGSDDLMICYDDLMI